MLKPMVVIASQPSTLRLITRSEYHQMAEAGILTADEQVELIAGQIIQKMPKGPARSAICKRIEKLLERRLEEQVLVRMQDPVQLGNYSEPEPDIAVVHPSDNFYENAHPIPSQVYLVVEVADSTLEQDLTTKANLYAAEGIIEYWVVNVKAQQLHVFRDPLTDGYQRQIILKAQQPLSLLAFPDCSILVRDCFSSNR